MIQLILALTIYNSSIIIKTVIGVMATKPSCVAIRL